MRQLAIISQEDNEIDRKLSDCVKHLENAGVWVYATNRGQGYAVIWADDYLFELATQQLIDAGFAVAPLTRKRSIQIRTPAPPAIVSNQNSRGLSAPQTCPTDNEGALQHASNMLPGEYHAKRSSE
jgi:hypothetical protein